MRFGSVKLNNMLWNFSNLQAVLLLIQGQCLCTGQKGEIGLPGKDGRPGVQVSFVVLVFLMKCLMVIYISKRYFS